MVGSKRGPDDFDTVDTRPLGILIRVNTTSHVTQFPYSPEDNTPGTEFPEAREAIFSPTGDCFVSIEGETGNAIIRNAIDASKLASCGGADDPQTPLKISQAIFSPKGTYLLTWARPVNGVSVPNLVIYEVATGRHMAAFHQKIFHVGFWPTVQWSDDESIAARAVTNNVFFFKGNDLSGAPETKLNIPGVTQFALSHKSKPYSIAAFVPGAKGAPGRIGVFQHPDEGGKQLSSRSTYRAESVDFEWNCNGTAVLAKVSTTVDASGKSYYGESELYFFDSKGTVDTRIELPAEGPTYDAAWSPSGLEFIVIYGFMPARATMFNDKCEPVFDFGTGARNTISFSPHGRFVALAGFGNLAGIVEIWDKTKMALVGRTSIPCTTMYSWSPCSRYFLGATTFPRLRVDNGLRVVRVDGKLIHEHKYGDNRLHQAVFRPASRGTYDNPKNTLDQMIGGPLLPPSEAIAPPTGKKGGVYRPPGSRGAASTLAVHNLLEAKKVDKNDFLAKSAAVASKPSMGAGAGKRIVPGMDPELVKTGPSKSSIARKKKKERAAKAQNDGAPSGQTEGEGESKEIAPEDIDSIEAGEKRAKKLKKKLRAIQVLKDNKAEGTDLNQEQTDKVASEDAVADELDRVEKRVAELRVG